MNVFASFVQAAVAFLLFCAVLANDLLTQMISCPEQAASLLGA